MTVWNTANVLWATQLMILSLVLSLWMDMMGNFEAGLNIALFVMIAAMAVLLSPAIETAYEKLREITA